MHSGVGVIKKMGKFCCRGRAPVKEKAMRGNSQFSELHLCPGDDS